MIPLWVACKKLNSYQPYKNSINCANSQIAVWVITEKYDSKYHKTKLNNVNRFSLREKETRLGKWVLHACCFDVEVVVVVAVTSPVYKREKEGERER